MNKVYDNYKETGVSWLPRIPEHWELIKFKYRVQYTTGFTPPTGEDKYYNGDITWITITDLNNKYVDESETKLSQLAIDKFNPSIAKKYSLLFSFKLSVGKVAFANKDLYTNEAIIAIEPAASLDLRYFYYTLPEQLLNNANENIYGAKILNQEIIKSALITFPPLDEQTIIAEYLDKMIFEIDELISENRVIFGNTDKKTGLIQEYKQAMINEVSTGQLKVF